MYNYNYKYFTIYESYVNNLQVYNVLNVDILTRQHLALIYNTM